MMTDRTPTNDNATAGRSDAYLIVKRGLYYRPKAQGYTGIRDHAGRYTLAEASKHADPQEGVAIVHEDDAPEFTSACYHDLKEAHLTKQRDALQAALEAATARADKAEAELRGTKALHAGQVITIRKLRAERDAALSREKEAKAALRDLLSVVGKAINTDEKLAAYQAAVANAAAALAQSGGADPAQGMGDGV